MFNFVFAVAAPGALPIPGSVSGAMCVQNKQGVSK